MSYFLLSLDEIRLNKELVHLIVKDRLGYETVHS